MSPVPADVRKMMFKLKKIQGTDISRSFDGLNNPVNLANSFKFAKEGGMIAQGALSITYSPVHTVDYYVNLMSKVIQHWCFVTIVFELTLSALLCNTHLHEEAQDMLNYGLIV